MANFRPGYLARGTPLGMAYSNVMLIADNQVVPTGGVGLILLSSNDTTSTNRTFILNASTLVGQQLVVIFESGASTAAELADSGTCQLAGTWTAGQYDTITLVWDGNYWIEICRSNN